MSNPIKPTIKSEAVALIIIFLAILLGVYFYFNLPELVITHWNFAGQADAWGSGKFQSIFFPLLIIAMYLLFLFMPYLDPKKERYEQFIKVYHIFKNIILGLFLIIFLTVGLNNLGYNLPVDIVIPAMIGLLFIVTGNYLGKIKPNWFMGIRTPWTLSSEEVWNKTHRFGGKMFILAGLLMILEAFLPLSWKLPVFIAMIAVLLLGTIGYSYVVYLKEKR